MSSIGEGLNAVLAGNAVANAFWVFVGVVAGALIQYTLGLLTARAQRRNAMNAFLAETEINLSALDDLEKRVLYLKERVQGVQIEDGDLFVSMQAFDYSMINPLVNFGAFHVMLGPSLTKDYFEFARFFSNQNAETVNSVLRTEHARGKSLDYLDFLLRRIREGGAFLKRFRGARLTYGKLALK